MTSPIKTGVLAYGMSGKLFHVPFIVTNSKFELTAVTERSKKEVHKKYPEVKSYDTVHELIADKDIELVIINTPNNTHFEFAKQAILAGKHVLLEKPMVPTKAEAVHLFELGKKHQKHVLVYQNRRWDNDFAMMKKVLDDGDIGNPIEAHFRFDRYRAEIGPKAFKEKPVPGSGIDYDLGSHLIDQVISLFGKPEKSIKLGSKNRKETEIEDYVCFVLSYSSGLQVYVTVSYMVADAETGYIIHGTKGSFKKERTDVQENQLLAGILPTDSAYGKEENPSPGQLTLINDQAEKTTTLIQPKEGNYSALFDAVYNQIRNDKPFEVTKDEILSQLELLEQPFWNQQ